MPKQLSRNDKIKLVIIDLHAILHLVKYSQGKKLKECEHNTFVIHGFLYKLRALMGKIGPAHVVFACDSVESKRKEIYKRYKSNRRNKPPEVLELDALAYPQFDAIKQEILPMIGYTNIFEVPGYEADDIIAKLCTSYPRNTKVLVTEDKDIYQCLSDNTAIFKPLTSKYFTKDDFMSTYRIKPDKWAMVKTLGGCSSDNIPGLSIINSKGLPSKRGFGERTALKYITGALGKSTSAYFSVDAEENREIKKRNKSLVTLPFPGLPELRIKPNMLSADGLLQVAKGYNFKYIEEDIEGFKEALFLK